VVLSESAARLLWPEQNPIGRSIRMNTQGQFHPADEIAPDGPAYQVIGVARDTRGVLMDGSDSEQIYVQTPDANLADYPLLIRTQADPTQLIRDIEPVIASVDPDLMVTSTTLDALLHQTESFIISSLCAAIASTVGFLGLVLTSMGIYGTISYIVVLRTREVGIRIALGASKRDILGLLMWESTRPVMAGLAAGMMFAVGVSYLLRGVMYGLHTVDGMSFAGVSVLFVAIALLATYLPSRRAMRTDPVVALRAE
jgi:ABC-type antimicrobial peptide transport system permease subunit